MDSTLHNNLTVIIPTHNRETYLLRSLSYWQDIEVRVIIVDSSAAAPKLDLPRHIEYFHFPDTSFSGKVKTAMDMVQTPYVVMCADDDFLVEQGMLACVTFLQENANYDAAQGRHVSFKGDDGLVIKEIYRSDDDFNVCCDDMGQRVIQGLSNYTLWYWSVHRSATLKLVYREYETVSNGNLIEIGVAIGHLAKGGHIQLPGFYQARESLPQSWGRVEPELSFDDSDHSDIIEWRKRTLTIISELSGVSMAEAEQVLKQGETAYQQFFDSARTAKAKRYNQIINVLPLPVIKLLKWCKRQLRGQQAANGRFIPQQQFVWPDEQAKQSWQKIMQYLD